MNPPPLALVRAVPGSFPDCIVAGADRPTIDVAAARRQHLGYRAALGAYGYRVHVLPSDDRYPDAAFVEDTVVVVGSVALLARPGAEQRRGEVDGVAGFIAGRMPARQLDPPGTLDGGDVLRVGDRLFVGRSTRTDDGGISVLRDLADAQGLGVVVVDVRRALHLKSAVTALDEATLLAAEGRVDLDPFAGFDVVAVPKEEHPAANVLRLGPGRVLMAAGYPETRRRVEAAGVEVVVVDLSEFVKADGGPTCLSVLLAASD